MNLQHSGLGKNDDYTFKKAPTKGAVDGDQMADIFFDLGLTGNMAGYTEGACVDTIKQYPGEKKVKQLAKPGINLRSVSKEKVPATDCDFLVGWDDLFSDKNYSVKFCKRTALCPISPMFVPTGQLLTICIRIMPPSARSSRWKRRRPNASAK